MKIKNPDELHAYSRLEHIPSNVKFAQFKKLFRYFLNEKGWLCLLIILILVNVLVSLIPPYLIKLLFDEGFLRKNVTVLWQVAFAYIFIISFGAVFSQAIDYLNMFVGAKVSLKVRKDFLTHIFFIPLPIIERKKTGDLFYTFMDNLEEVQGFILENLSDFLIDILFVLLTIGILFFIHVPMALISLVALPLWAYTIHWINRKKASINQDVIDKQAQLYSIIEEEFSHLMAIKIFSWERRSVHEYLSETINLVVLSLKLFRWNAALNIILALAAPSLTVLFYLIGGIAIIKEEMTIGIFMAFNTYLLLLWEPVQAIFGIQTGLNEFFVSLMRVFSIMDIEEETSDAAVNTFTVLKNDIIFEDVNYQYRGEDQTTILEHFDLSIKKGEKFAVCGPSGSGKSTISKLLFHFYKPQSGRITIDGKDLKTYDLASLRKNIIYVPQEDIIFSGTLRKNLLLYNEQATDNEMIAALEKVQFLELFRSLPNGLDSLIGGEGGFKLSGGEDQKIALARVFLSQGEFYIFDEHTSNLDYFTEALVQEALFEFLEGKTAIFIAHRLHTLKKADYIVFLKDGKIVDNGSFEELMREKGIFYEYYQLHLNDFKTFLLNVRLEISRLNRYNTVFSIAKITIVNIQASKDNNLANDDRIKRAISSIIRSLDFYNIYGGQTIILCYPHLCKSHVENALDRLIAGLKPLLEEKYGVQLGIKTCHRSYEKRNVVNIEDVVRFFSKKL